MINVTNKVVDVIDVANDLINDGDDGDDY